MDRRHYIAGSPLLRRFRHGRPDRGRERETRDTLR